MVSGLDKRPLSASGKSKKRVAARAYRAIAEENISLSPELVLLQQVDRFGTFGVYGRALSHREIIDLNMADAVRVAYESREKADSWAGWQKQNPQLSMILNKAMKENG